MTTKEEKILDARTTTDPTVRPRTLFAISGMAMVAGFGGALAISRYRSARAARAATTALRQEARNMAAVANAASSASSASSASANVGQELSRSAQDALAYRGLENASRRETPLDPFNPALYAAKALGIATCIVGAVATVIVVGGIQYGMDIRSMNEFSSRMKLFWGGNFSSLRKAILENEANEMEHETAAAGSSNYGRFKPLNAPPPSSVQSRDQLINLTSEEDGGQKWWDDLKREMDEDVANERKRQTG